MLHDEGPGINRSATGGLQNLRFAPKGDIGRYPPAVPSDYTNIVAEKFHVQDPKKKRDRNFLDPKTVSNNEFKSAAHSRYQGQQQGATGSDFLQLPLSWAPEATASYQPDIAGDAFEKGDGQVAEMNNLETKLPKMDVQFSKKNSFLTPDKPDPFPIQLSSKFRIK